MNRRAWTAEQVAAATGAPLEVASKALEDAVTAGECVRLASRTTPFYIAGALRDLLEELDVLPADEADVDALRATVSAKKPSESRIRWLRKRVARALAGPNPNTKERF